MDIIVITAPDFIPGEAEAITTLLDSGAADRVHVRKPQCSESELRSLIESIPRRLRGRISLHDHLCLATACGLGGVHLNSRNPTAPDGFRGIVSRSCHSTDELRTADGCEYVFLSPVFDSISKPGYGGHIGKFAAARRALTHAYALGGVTPERFAQLRRTGFRGAALLGYIWNCHADGRLMEVIKKISQFR